MLMSHTRMTKLAADPVANPVKLASMSVASAVYREKPDKCHRPLASRRLCCHITTGPPLPRHAAECTLHTSVLYCVGKSPAVVKSQ